MAENYERIAKDFDRLAIQRGSVVHPTTECGMSKLSRAFAQAIRSAAEALSGKSDKDCTEIRRKIRHGTNIDHGYSTYACVERTILSVEKANLLGVEQIDGVRINGKWFTEAPKPISDHLQEEWKECAK